jgi:hypothetical protein
MRKLALVLPLVACMLSTVGCIDLEQEYTINPDGSGKVVVHWIGAPFDFGPDKAPEARAKELLKDEITKSEGVDAWKDVSCTTRDDGKFEFKATAYFKDFSKLKLHNTGMSMIALKATKDDAGNLVIVNEPEKKKGDKPKPMTDEEAKKKLKEERAEYQQNRRLIEPMFADLKVSAKVNLPGKVGTATNFKKVSDTSIRITLEGKTFLKVLDEIMANDEWLLKMLKEHGKLQDSPSDDMINEKIFGEKGPIRAVTSGALKPLFDYEKESAEARAQTEEMVKKFGGGPVAPPAKGGDFKALRVAGIHHVYETDMERGLWVGRQGVTISLLGELPGTVLSMKGGKIVTAVTDNGEDILPEEYNRTIHSVQLSKDKSGVAWEVQLGSPSDKAKGFKEVSGVLTYLVGEKTKAVDLGLGEFKAGAKGAQYEASIEKVENNPWQEGHQNLEIKIACQRDIIESFTIKDASGSVLATTDGGWSSMGETSTFTFTIKGTFPAKGQVVVSVYEDLKTYEIPFKIQNIDLLGKPLK